MTCYIPSIEEPEGIYKIRIRRFDPSRDEKPHFKTYEIPHVKTMTVVEALEYLWDQGEYIAFRANCREFTCGSCAMLINGKAWLACDTLLENNMTLEPLSRYPVVKDLVVDTRRVKAKLRNLEYWPVIHENATKFQICEKVLDNFNKIYSRCVECYCCLEACPSSSSERSQFGGPMYLLQIARAGEHPLDNMDRIQQAAEQGIWSCVSCFECSDACPIDLSPGEIIADLRRMAIKEKIFQLLKIQKD